jgi:hypothetical protein
MEKEKSLKVVAVSLRNKVKPTFSCPVVAVGPPAGGVALPLTIPH